MYTHTRTKWFIFRGRAPDNIVKNVIILFVIPVCMYIVYRERDRRRTCLRSSERTSQNVMTYCIRVERVRKFVVLRVYRSCVTRARAVTTETIVWGNQNCAYMRPLLISSYGEERGCGVYKFFFGNFLFFSKIFRNFFRAPPQSFSTINDTPIRCGVFFCYWYWKSRPFSKLFRDGAYKSRYTGKTVQRTETATNVLMKPRISIELWVNLTCRFWSDYFFFFKDSKFLYIIMRSVKKNFTKRDRRRCHIFTVRRIHISLSSYFVVTDEAKMMRYVSNNYSKPLLAKR